MLNSGLARIGFRNGVAARYQLWQLNAVGVAESVDEPVVPKRLLSDFKIEFATGLGPFKGKIRCVGLAEENSTQEDAETVMRWLRTIVKKQTGPFPASR